MSEEVKAEIVILGGGPGGYVSAIRAAQLGANPVVVIEKDTIGGTCLNRGCIPAKAFVESSIRYKQAKEAKKFGISISDISFDFTKIQQRKQQVVSRITKGVGYLLEGRGIKVLKGSGSFIDNRTVKVTGGEEEYTVSASKAIIIATGSKSFLVPIPGVDGKNVITSDEILDFSEVPKSLVVIGGGVIGDEFACVFNSFGCKVTVVEMLDYLIPMEDQEMGIELEKAFKRQKIAVHTKSRVTKISDDETGLKKVTFIDPNGDEQEVTADYVLMSVGRIPEINGLNPEAAGIETGNRGIKANSKLETNVPGIYVIGDVIEGPHPMLAYTASQEGEIAAENIMGHEAVMDYRATPSCIFTDPEVASVGLREHEAKEKDQNILIGRFPFAGIGKAVIHGEVRGLVKVILDGDNHEILGCHIIGPHATELIAEMTLAVQNRMTANDIIETQHCHPVLYEAIKEAVLDALGRAIHK